METMKKCTMCLEYKPVIGYYKKAGAKDGHSRQCKSCVSHYNNQPKYRENATKVKNKYIQLKYSAKRRNYELHITFEQYCVLIKDNICYYCGESNSKFGHGLDRVDSSKGYTMDNVRPCCGKCNKMKLNHTENDFLLHLVKIVNKLSLRS